MATKRKTVSRREFLARGATGMASAGVVGVLGNRVPVLNPDRQIQAARGDIMYRTLGKTGIRIPIVNMGVMNTSDAALIKRSYEIGVRHFDTAAGYMRGKNEEVLGQAIKDLGVRDQVVISTKIYVRGQERDMSPEKAKETYLRVADESLKRLQMEHVDILYSHNVDTLEWLNNPGVIEALKQLKKEGKARFIGFTTHANMTTCINDAIRSGHFDVIETAYNYALSDDTELKSTLKKAAAAGIGLVAMKTQCSQYWYKDRLDEALQRFYEGSILHTAVLKWALKNDYITTAIPGYTTYQQMDEDFSVAHGLDYTDKEKAFLEDRKVKLSLGYCRQCRQCLPSCPHGVDVPTLMRTHMYAACYANFYQARDAMQEIDPSRGISTCISCNTCQARCVNRIDIGRRIDELKAIRV